MVPADEASDVLLSLPQNLLFQTNATVEVVRLIRARWKEFPADKRASIQDRIIAGPPTASFVTDGETMADRSRYNLLGEMQRAGLELNDASTSVLASIKSKYPNWQLRPPEQAGFHIWRGGSSWITGDSDKFKNISDDTLIDEAKKASDNADFMEGNHWQALSQADPKRALRGLAAKAQEGQWPAWAWNPFLWAAQKLDDPDSVNIAADLLLKFPEFEFKKIADTTSWWLNEKAKGLDENRLWRLWDKVEAATELQTTEGDNA